MHNLLLQYSQDMLLKGAYTLTKYPDILFYGDEQIRLFKSSFEADSVSQLITAVSDGKATTTKSYYQSMVVLHIKGIKI